VHTVLEILSLVELIVETVVGDALELVEAELATVLHLLAPVVSPIVEFVGEAVALVNGTVDNDVLARIGGMTAALDEVLGMVGMPVDGSVKAIAGSDALEKLKAFML
jgi:hypothetical protein